jgi:hypothetical protein
MWLAFKVQVYTTYHVSYATAVCQTRRRFSWNSHIISSILCVSLRVHFTQLVICDKYEHKFTNATNYSVASNVKIFQNHRYYLKISYIQLHVPTHVKSMEITGMNSFTLHVGCDILNRFSLNQMNFYRTKFSRSPTNDQTLIGCHCLKKR